MTFEYLEKQKTKYKQKQEYFKNIGFDGLSAEFKDVVDLIEEVESYMKEKENGQDHKD